MVLCVGPVSMYEYNNYDFCTSSAPAVITMQCVTPVGTDAITLPKTTKYAIYCVRIPEHESPLSLYYTFLTTWVGIRPMYFSALNKFNSLWLRGLITPLQNIAKARAVNERPESIDSNRLDGNTPTLYIELWFVYSTTPFNRQSFNCQSPLTVGQKIDFCLQ